MPSESDTQREAIAILARAQRRGEPVPCHNPQAKRVTSSGEPDIKAVVGDTFFLVEVKTATGVLSEQQVRWLTAAGQCRRVVAMVVTDETLDQLAAIVSEVAGGVGAPGMTNHPQTATERADGDVAAVAGGRGKSGGKPVTAQDFIDAGWSADRAADLAARAREG